MIYAFVLRDTIFLGYASHSPCCKTHCPRKPPTGKLALCSMQQWYIHAAARGRAREKPAWHGIYLAWIYACIRPVARLYTAPWAANYDLDMHSHSPRCKTHCPRVNPPRGNWRTAAAMVHTAAQGHACEKPAWHGILNSLACIRPVARLYTAPWAANLRFWG